MLAEPRCPCTRSALRQHASESAQTAAKIAIDGKGKTLKGSLDRFMDQVAVQWVFALAIDAKVGAQSYRDERR